MSVPTYDSDALWTKAKLFLNRAMDGDECRTFDERALWASLALELLAKAALARVSPLLIADPTEDGTNLLVASGLVEGEARFVSVRAHTLYSRCTKAFKPFNESEARKITNARNEYLHGAGVGFLGIPEHAWWPRFWSQASILVNALDSDIESLVGESRVMLVNEHLAQNKRNIEHRAEALIARAQQRLAQRRAGELTAKIDAEWERVTDLTLGMPHKVNETCPACDALGDLEGDEITDQDVSHEQIDESDYEILVTLKIESDYFSCSTCHLTVEGYELLEQVGLPTTFEVAGDPGDYLEPEYGND